MSEHSSSTLANSQPSPVQLRIAACAALIMIGIMVSTWPLAHLPGPRLLTALSAYQSVVVFTDVITAMLLLTQFRQTRAPGFLALACAYLFTGLVATFHLASFPGVFAEKGLMGGPQTASYLWMVWHGTFPLVAVWYGWMSRKAAPVPAGRAAMWGWVGTGATVAAACAVLGLVTLGHDLLPPLISGESFAPQERLLQLFFAIGVASCVVMLPCARRSVVELWLAVSVLAFTLDILSNLHAGSRFDVGWYLGRGYSLIASTLVMAVYVVQISFLLRQQAVLLQQVTAASAAKSRFFAAASHDLRQPFQAMRLFYTVLEPRIPAPQRMPFERLGQAMGSAESLLNELLDMARLEKGDVPVNLQTVDLAALISEVCSELAPVAEGKGLKLRQRPRAGRVVTDPLLLKRIMFNLMTNAIRYTEQGSVLVGLRRRGGRMVVEVWDTGIGIGEHDAAAVFEEFYQVGNSNRDRAHGLGLGLSIVKRLANMLGCQITMASRVGRGTVFRVALAA